MEVYTKDATDTKSLLGDAVYADYLRQQQAEELLEAAATAENDRLICFFCLKSIKQNQLINLHHPQYKSEGGTHVEPAHETCHVEYHSRQGDYRDWGRRSAETRRWAFNLKGVKDHPAYDFDRAYYLMLYAR
jgi:hypothetical protein